MDYQRSQSLQPNFEPNTRNVNNSSVPIRSQFRFTYQNRVPETLRSHLSMIKSGQSSSMMRRKSSEKEEKGEAERSKIGSLMRSKFQEIRGVAYCEICEGEFRVSSNTPFMCNCPHKYNFCESCLHHYTIFKINSFQQVPCPSQDCQSFLDEQSPLYFQLPLDIQRKHKKIEQFHFAANNPDYKLCPREECEGLVKQTGSRSLRCEKCRKEFCDKCLLERHEGECDQKELLFFKQNLHYRQCKRCNFVIEKNQGCNHMTCRCGYQFCYVCGAKWSSPHYGNHDEQGNLLDEDGDVVQPNCCERCRDRCECCEDCQLFDDCPSLLFCLTCPLRLVCSVLFFILMLPEIIFKNLLVLVFMFVIAILIGVFGYPCEWMSQSQGCQCLLMIVFLPLTMLVGIFCSIQQFFCVNAPQVLEDTVDRLADGCSEIWSA